jgi:hypothetical protein
MNEKKGRDWIKSRITKSTCFGILGKSSFEVAWVKRADAASQVPVKLVTVAVVP